MPKHEDAPEEAEAAIGAASDAASHLEYATALAADNLAFAETTLRYARESGKASEISDAEREVVDAKENYEALKVDTERAIQHVYAVQAEWGY
jgi:hypothetical protein